MSEQSSTIGEQSTHVDQPMIEMFFRDDVVAGSSLDEIAEQFASFIGVRNSGGTLATLDEAAFCEQVTGEMCRVPL